ncbi:hypothetical protein KR222_003307 [Zaprionus bogoriensis]|nr:hypothetical protein KR222_003307 [Zaprionus bogoriensis]
MSFCDIFENSLIMLHCIRANVMDILQEYRLLGMGPHTLDNIQETCLEMDFMRTRLYKMVVNMVPDHLSSSEEIEIVSEIIDMLLDTFNELNPEELYGRIHG